MSMNYVFLETTDSTLSYASAHQDELEDMTMISAHEQLAGRGQRGNSWESAPGKNLTVTLFHRPEQADMPTQIPMAVRQFRISEATALGVADTLARYGITATLKWPNDIYVGDRKICGILIEHTLMGGHIANSRIGIGVNANQREFLSDAPNPVSMHQLLGHDTNLVVLLENLSADLETRLQQAQDDPDSLHREYLGRLWRTDGRRYPFRHRYTELPPFMARIVTVHPDGMLELDIDGEADNRTFGFKEVEFIL